MKTYKVLVLTDHQGHSKENSIYAILTEMLQHEQCQQIDIASRGLVENHLFFENHQSDALHVSTLDAEFKFTESGEAYLKNLKKANVEDYNLVFLRLPRPLSDESLLWFETLFSNATIVNSAKGILATSSKAFLLNFPDVCPDIRLCTSIADVKEEVEKYPIVLKPLKEYGGRGLLKINKQQIDDGEKIYDTNTYLASIADQLEKDHYLSMRFLKNVKKGDKRILVVDGEIMASSLRLPAEDSWLCNVAQGGTSVPSEVTPDEVNIIAKIKTTLKEQGIFMYGVDTLEDDEGKRVLSEINTLSIGGWPQAQAQTGLPIISKLINKLFQHADRY
jgi:glutathione synthase